MIYYAVVQGYYNNGKVTANILTVPSESKPDDIYKSTKRCDIYIDYFDTYEAALQFKTDALNA